MNGTATSHNTSGSAFGRLAAASEPTGRVAAGAGERICCRERMVSLGPVGFSRFGARWDVMRNSLANCRLRRSFRPPRHERAKTVQLADSAKTSRLQYNEEFGSWSGEGPPGGPGDECLG